MVGTDGSGGVSDERREPALRFASACDSGVSNVPLKIERAKF